MANDEDLIRVRQGAGVWNNWRMQNRGRLPDLTQANLEGADLAWANLEGVNLSGARLTGATLASASLVEAKLVGADLEGANLGRANLVATNMSGASLRRAKLGLAVLVGTDLTGADLTGCWIYGISAWDLRLEGAIQQDLVITLGQDHIITVDDIEVGQFIYLFVHNANIRKVIDTITSRVVLIVGRFTAERKAVLDLLRNRLREYNYVPVLFDFNPPNNRNFTETISLLARMARFVIADITEPRCVPHELMAIVPDLPSVPIQPLQQKGTEEYGMFEDYRNYPWVLKKYVYTSIQQLMAGLGEQVIGAAEAKLRELRSIGI